MMLKRCFCVCVFRCCFFFLVFFILIVLGFNNTSILVGHFVLSLRERDKRDRRDSRRDAREGQGIKRKINESY